MAFSFKLPKMTGVGNGGSSAPMTLSADAPSGKTQLPGFLSDKPVVEQMKILGAFLLPCFW